MDAPQEYKAGLHKLVATCLSRAFASIRPAKCRLTRLSPLTLLVLLALGIVSVQGSHEGHGNPDDPTGSVGRAALPQPEHWVSRAHGSSLWSATAPLKLADTYARLPMSFEANQGQAPNDVQFISRGSGYTLLLARDGMVVGLRRPISRSSQYPRGDGQLPGTHTGHVRENSAPQSYIESQRTGDQSRTMLRLKLIGINPGTRPVGVDPVTGRSNYFVGRDPAKWRTNVMNYSRVSYRGLYPGIDLVYYGNQRHLEYDFVLAPGAEVEQIAWELEGLSSLSPASTIDSQGNLLVYTGSGTLRLNKPIVYEISGNQAGRRFLEGRYVRKDNGQFGFAVESRDPSKTLVIDPVLDYSTYLGGGADDLAWSIAVDSNGDAYVAGQTLSIDFPVTTGAFLTTCASCAATTPGPDAFVTKFNPTGSSLIYSTYLGGSATDVGFGIAVDASGNAYVTGSTSSTDFPFTLGAFQNSFGGGASDAFVTKLNPLGSQLIYSTYLGGSKSDTGLAIATDSVGNAYVTGSTSSSNFPILNPLPLNGNLKGTQNAFVAIFDPLGVRQYSTYLGGSDQDTGYGIAVDTSALSGGIYIAGQTNSNNFPTVNALQGTFKGVADAFVSKLKLDGTALIYSTYLGGTASDGAFALAIDSSGNAYVTGSTASTDFPATPGAFQTSFAGGASDAFVAKLNPLGSQLIYSTYLGGSDQDIGNGIAVDGSGNANVVGETTSADFPTANPIQPKYNANTDAFVTQLVPMGCAPTLSTYLGGSDIDVGTGIAVDSSGNLFVTGRTKSNDFPTQKPLQPQTGGGSDAFVTRLNSFPAPALCLNPNNLTFPGQALTTTSAAAPVTVTNGANPNGPNLQITGINANGSFGETNTCLNSSIPPGGTCTIDVTFAPNGVAANKGSISITDNAGGSPQSIALLGIGTDFNMTVSPPTATVTAGKQATFTLTVSPLGGFNSTVALTCGDLPPNSTCNFSQNSVTLNGSAATPTVTISTAARSGLVRLRDPEFPAPGWYVRAAMSLLVSLAILVVMTQMLRRRKNLNTAGCVRLAGFAGVILAAMFWSSCGFKTNAPSGTAAGNYPLALTGTNGSLQHTIRVTLVVN